jgi:hypothetical protein
MSWSGSQIGRSALMLFLWKESHEGDLTEKVGLECPNEKKKERID